MIAIFMRVDTRQSSPVRLTRDRGIAEAGAIDFHVINDLGGYLPVQTDP